MRRLCLLIVVFFSHAATRVVFAQEPVYFADARLKAIIEDELWIYDPTPADLLALTELRAIGEGISDLAGLDFAVNLQTLYLRDNLISDISALSVLINLRTLNLSKNSISDLTPLAGLENLRHLDMHKNNIGDVAPLHGLSNLETLIVRFNKISDISPLSGLPNLTSLNLWKNEVSDVSALSGLPNLMSLSLGGNHISDISVLSELPNLTSLHLPHNQISNVSALSGLANLTSLVLSYNQISDISVLTGLTKLREFSLSNNQISDISALSGFTDLRELWLYNDPLNEEAYDIYIPQIISNNPDIAFHFDPQQDIRYTLTTSSSAGGSVVLPGEDIFSYDKDTSVAVTAAPDDACHYFVNWTGTAVDAGTIDDPDDPNTFFIASGDHTLRANFHSRTIYVDDDALLDPGPGDLHISDPYEDGTEDHPFDSIQEAIDAVSLACRQVVFVKTGTYNEAINFAGKNITLTGINPASPEITAYPTIAAHDASTTVTFNHAEGPSCQLSGFVLTHRDGKLGRGIECLGSSPSIKNCLIVGNRSAGANDATIYCQDSRSLFENLTISGNYAGDMGSAFRFTDCNAVIANSILSGNLPGEITVESGNDPVVVYTDVQGSWPGVHNIDQDPGFARPGYWAASTDPDMPATDPAGADAIWVDGDYHLMSENGRWNPNAKTWAIDEYTSPCVGAGDRNWLHLDGPNHRRRVINMGAFGRTSQASHSPTELVARWTFDESSGNIASDSLGGNHGTVSGALWTDGIMDGALQFDGEDDQVDCGNDPAIAPDLLTIAMWVYPQASSGSRTVLQKAAGMGKDYEFELFGARNPTFSFGDGSQSLVLYSGSKLPLNEWTHVTLTRDETEAAIYVNGMKLMSKTYDFSPLATDHNLIIGGGSLQPYKGKIDDVQIYKLVLPDEDIARIFSEVVLQED